MNKKQIRTYLNKEFDAWLDTITHDPVKRAIRDHAFIAGGAITSLLLNEDPKDIDIYFDNKDAALTVAEFYVNKFNLSNDWHYPVEVHHTNDSIKLYVKSDGIAQVPLDAKIANGGPAFISPVAISLHTDIGPKFQLIFRWIGEPLHITCNFDFMHTKCAYIPKQQKLNDIDPDTLLAILNRQLIYTGSDYPVASIMRARKFIERNWSCSAGELAKIAFQISQLDLTNIDVLMDQLVGVDIMYMLDVIAKLKDRDGPITHDIFMSTIDEVFNN